MMSIQESNMKFYFKPKTSKYRVGRNRKALFLEMGDVFPLQALTRHVTLFAQTAGGKEYETVTVDHLGMVEDIRRRYYGIRCGRFLHYTFYHANPQRK